MPELPEVETLVRRLREPLVGRTILTAAVQWPRTIGRPAPREFARRVRGLTIQAITRRAKYLVFELCPQPSAVTADPHPERSAAQSKDADQPSQFLLTHLKMSGKLSVVDRTAPILKHDRVIFDLDDGRQLRFNDIRKFGRMHLVPDMDAITGALGPEPLDRAFTLSQFRALISARSGAIKPLLLNQHFLAGVGNIYADEALWYAKIHPQRKAASLQAAEIAALYRSIRRVLKQAIDDRGTDAGDGIIEGDYRPRVYGREGRPCYRCHHPIHKIVVGQRGTHYCPHCARNTRGNEAKS
jgi:formamidopyrimidine-DNA glycosylase